MTASGQPVREPGTLMIVEAEASAAQALAETLEAGGFVVSGHTTTGAEAVDMARRLAPDLILMDVLLGDGSDGTAVARAIREWVNVPILYMSARCDEGSILDAIRSGAVGYLIKPVDARQVTAAVTVALAIQPGGRRRVFPTPPAWIDKNGPAEGHASSDGAGLPVSPREREVVRCLVGHRRLPVVADVLGISVHTARNHLKSVFRKLHLHSQDELFRYLQVDDDGNPPKV